jgi:AmmeMemoRadiSam system protein B
MIRRAAVAGQFYSGSVGGLMEEVQACIDKDAQRVDALGAVCPHAGFMYSGRVAGAVYSRINPPDTYIIIGPNHHGLGSDFSIMTDGVWRMPFGEVRVDSLLAKEVFKRSKHLSDDPFAQEMEHSIEVQLPFMQYFKKDFEIVPISLRHYEPEDSFLGICQEIGKAIAHAVAQTRCKVTIIASTDITHYQPQKVATANDKVVLDAILALDEVRLFKDVQRKRISMCGFAPAAAMISACRELGAKRGSLVKYMTSGDITGDFSSVVGYGGALITL